MVQKMESTPTNELGNQETLEPAFELHLPDIPWVLLKFYRFRAR